MVEYLLIDGYNIIYSWPDLDKLKESSLEHARDRLIGLMSNYAALSGERVIIVFDAYLVKNNQERVESYQGLDVIYTQEGETADRVIERMVGELVKLGNVHVATSDWAEQSMIFGRGAYRITPGELLKRVRRLNEEGMRPYKNGKAADAYLENLLGEEVRLRFEKWRRRKD